jgi:GTP-binding protein Era
MTETKRCGYVAIIGIPNVGKSTLLNCILGKKISITTPKPQTTQKQILGIKTVGEVQSIYIDTPGMHDGTEKKAINRYMNRLANAVIDDADVIIFMITERWHPEDNDVLFKLKNTKKPVILVINKVDALSSKSLLLPLMEQMAEMYPFEKIIPISAKNADNIDALEAAVATFFPEGPHLFPDDQVTDKTIQHQVSEIVREKIILATAQELPYSVVIEVEKYEVTQKIVNVSAIIWVEREGQKPIIIGAKGAGLKKIGTQARLDLEKLLGQKVFLQLWVKVKENWSDNEKFLSTLGY